MHLTFRFTLPRKRSPSTPTAITMAGTSRHQRLAKMKSLGIIPPETTLTPRSKYYDWGEFSGVENPSWDSLAEDRRADLARRMAIYAAMVDRMDQNVGRVLDELRKRSELDNTLVVFTSDNGAVHRMGCLWFRPQVRRRQYFASWRRHRKHGFARHIP